MKTSQTLTRLGSCPSEGETRRGEPWYAWWPITTQQRCCNRTECTGKPQLAPLACMPPLSNLLTSTVPTVTQGTRPLLLTRMRHFAPCHVPCSCSRNCHHAPPPSLPSYLATRLDRVVDEPYSVVWFHTRSTYWKNCPSLMWMWRTYER